VPAPDIQNRLQRTAVVPQILQNRRMIPQPPVHARQIAITPLANFFGDLSAIQNLDFLRTLAEVAKHASGRPPAGGPAR
jgi:hypothetical protein